MRGNDLAVAPTILDRCWQFALFLAYRTLLVCWFIFRPQRTGAAVVVWFGEDVLLIRNSYRSPCSVPAGGVERGEAPVDAAVRELREEVAICVDADQLGDGVEIVSRAEYKRDTCYFFEVHLDERPEVRIDNREITEARFVSFESVTDIELTDTARQFFEWKRKQLAAE